MQLGKMNHSNAIVQIGFPDTIEAGFEIVTGTRIEQYLAAHPNATEADACKAAKARMTSAATAL